MAFNKHPDLQKHIGIFIFVSLSFATSQVAALVDGEKVEENPAAIRLRLKELERQKKQILEDQQKARKEFEDKNIVNASKKREEREAIAKEIGEIDKDLLYHRTSCDYMKAISSGKKMDATEHNSHVREQKQKLSELKERQLNLITKVDPLVFDDASYRKRLMEVDSEIGNLQNQLMLSPSGTNKNKTPSGFVVNKPSINTPSGPTPNNGNQASSRFPGTTTTPTSDAENINNSLNNQNGNKPATERKRQERLRTTANIDAYGAGYDANAVLNDPNATITEKQRAKDWLFEKEQGGSGGIIAPLDDHALQGLYVPPELQPRSSMSLFVDERTQKMLDDKLKRELEAADIELNKKAKKENLGPAEIERRRQETKQQLEDASKKEGQKLMQEQLDAESLFKSK